ncbi:MAG: cation diffusion facilitator family transporter [Thermodesulfovibrionales bacterium]
MDSRRQFIVLLLTIAYFFIELIGGLYYGSLALVTDASFMAINITGQIIALYVARLAMRKPTKNNTFGFERAKVLSGLFNGILVGFLLFYVFINAYGRITHPQPLEVNRVFFIAAIGLIVNAYGFFTFYKHSADMNLKGALLLIWNDALGSVGVIVSSIIIMYTGLYFVDPLAAVIIGVLVAYPTYFLLRDSVNILMEGNPAKIDPEDVKRFIRENFPDISTVKDLHIWGLSPEIIILTLRIRTNGMTYDRAGVKGIKRHLSRKFGFSDIYLELYEEKLEEEPSDSLMQEYG